MKSPPCGLTTLVKSHFRRAGLRWFMRWWVLADEGQWGVHTCTTLEASPGSWGWCFQSPKYPYRGLEKKTRDLCGTYTWPHRPLPMGRIQHRAVRVESFEGWGQEHSGFWGQFNSLKSNLLNTYSLDSLQSVTDWSEFVFLPIPLWDESLSPMSVIFYTFVELPHYLIESQAP